MVGNNEIRICPAKMRQVVQEWVNRALVPSEQGDVVSVKMARDGMNEYFAIELKERTPFVPPPEDAR